MKQESQVEILQDQVNKALWEIRNIMECIPEKMWEHLFCEMPIWKHVYHMLHSLDLWFINPRDQGYKEPDFHKMDMNDLDVISEDRLSKGEIFFYLDTVELKIKTYLDGLKESELLEYPVNCEYTKFTLIIAQIRHLHSHMGILMGFIISETGKWPRVLGLENEIPKKQYDKFF